MGTHVWGALVSGLITGIVIGKGSEYYTSSEYKPTRRIAEKASTGPGPVIIGGLGEGMASTLIPVIAVVIGMSLAFGFASKFQASAINEGLYGIGLAAVGMLATLGITLATDAYGPIADNAGGNAEMSGLPGEVRQRTDALDAIGNTTAATGKGFAIGSAALTALALIASYVQELKLGKGYDMSLFTVTMEYLTPVSHEYRTETLVLSEEGYEGHLKYVLPIDTCLTREAGAVELQLTFSCAELDDEGNSVQRVRKTSATTLDIIPIKAWSDIIPDNALTALDQRIIKVDSQIKALSELQGSKADNIKYDESENSLQLLSGGAEIGSKVVLKNSGGDMSDDALKDGIPAVDFGIKTDEDDEVGSDEKNNVIEF